MKKSNFVSLVLGSIGGIFFAIGMCMCLLPEWNAFKQGVVMGAVGLIVLLVMLIVRHKMQGKPAIQWNGRAIGIAAYGVAGSLILGVGMCMAMVWTHLMVPGIIVGSIGILLLLGLVPLIKGIKPET